MRRMRGRQQGGRIEPNIFSCPLRTSALAETCENAGGPWSLFGLISGADPGMYSIGAVSL
jgi:hypothetical protein